MWKEKLIKQLERIDIFGQEVALRYKNKTHYQTKFGGLMTLIWLALTFSFFISFLHDKCTKITNLYMIH